MIASAMLGADDPENLKPSTAPRESPEDVSFALQNATFDDQLIDHMVRCWDAQCDVAERLTKKINLIVSVLALLFGLGLFKVDWTYDPKHVSRVHSVAVLWGVKAALVAALSCFGLGLFRGLRGIRKGSDRAANSDEERQGEMASDLLSFSKEVVGSPPVSEIETRALVFYQLSRAVDELRRQNEAKAIKVRKCEFWFLWGLILVFVSVAIYTLFSYPPIPGG